MQIKVSHAVDGNGKIYLPYLHDWDASNSDILGLIQMCIITFGEQPPVFARPQNQGPCFLFSFPLLARTELRLLQIRFVIPLKSVRAGFNNTVLT